jgi:hypothetical protein
VVDPPAHSAALSSRESGLTSYLCASQGLHTRPEHCLHWGPNYLAHPSKLEIGVGPDSTGEYNIVSLDILPLLLVRRYIRNMSTYQRYRSLSL